MQDFHNRDAGVHWTRTCEDQIDHENISYQVPHCSRCVSTSVYGSRWWGYRHRYYERRFKHRWCYRCGGLTKAILTYSVRYQIYLPSSLSVVRGSPQTECHVVNIDIDIGSFLGAITIDMDVDQTKSVRVSLCCSQHSSMSSGEHDLLAFIPNQLYFVSKM